MKNLSKKIWRTAGRWVRREAEPLEKFFDANWYLKEFKDATVPDNALDHYMNQGGYLTRDPNPMFSTEWYFKQYPELRSEKRNPLIHYIETGEQAGSPPSPGFDPKWYLEAYPDVAKAGLSPLGHFLEHGKKEGRLPKRPRYFRTAAELSDFLASFKPSLDALGCSVDLELSSLRACAQEFGGAVGVRVTYEAGSDSCVGVEGPLAYPGPGFVARIDNAMAVAGSRYLLSRTGLILHDEEAHFYEVEGAAIKYNRARRSMLDGRLELNLGVRQAAWIERGVNIMHEYENNYFHFIAETIPRMMLVEEAQVPREVPFLMTGNLHPNIQELFNLTNTDRRPVITLENGTLYQVGEMNVPSDLTVVVDAYHGGPTARQTGLDVARIRKGIARCKDRFLPRSRDSNRKIFASRGGSYRCLLNQSEVEARMVEMGFEIVRTDQLSLQAQIRLFQEARIVVGPTGAQMSNMVWCHSGTDVIVLASDHPSHQLYLWQLLGQVSGAEVEILQGPRAYARTDLYSLHDDYHVDVEQVIGAIAKKGGVDEKQRR